MPVHTHVMRGTTGDPADVKIPNPNASWGISQQAQIYQDNNDVFMAPEALAPAGGDQPHNNMQPFLTLNFNIALQGVFPPRG